MMITTNKDPGHNHMTPDQGAARPAGGSLISMIRENLHYNLGTLLLGLLVMLFNYPLLMALSLSDIKHNMDELMMSSTAISNAAGNEITVIAEKITDYELRMSSTANELLSGMTGLMAFIVPVAAILCARAMFNYLMQRPTVDFYFSQPISRTKRFAANYLSGGLIMLICMVFGFVTSLIVAVCFGVKDINAGAALMYQLGFLLIFILLYTTVIIAMLLTGRPFAAVAAVVVLNGLGLAVYGIVLAYCNFFDTFSYESGLIWEKLYYTSPIYYLVEFMNRASSRAGIFAGGAIRLMALMAVLCAALVVIAALLHRIRPAEACGKTLSFRRTTMPLRIILTIIGGLLISFFGLYQSGALWLFFFLVLGVLIVHAICEISFNADIRALFDHRIEALGCLVAGLAFACIFVFDIFGYDAYVPKIEDVESVAFYYGGDFEARTAIPDSEYELDVRLNDPEIRYTSEYYDDQPEVLYSMAITEPEYVSAVLSMGACGAKKASGMNLDFGQSYSTGAYNYDEDEEFFSLDMVYRLKNGHERYRTYMLSHTELAEYMTDIFPSMEYKKAMYPILELTKEEFSPGLFGIEYKDQDFGDGLELRGELDGKRLYVSARGNTDWERYNKVYDISSDEGFEAELLAALQQDIANMRYEDYHDWIYSVYSSYDENGDLIYSSGSEYYQGEQQEGAYLVNDILYFIPASGVELAELREREDGIVYGEAAAYINQSDRYDYMDIYPIFESFTNVRELLESKGLLEAED